MKHLVQNTRDRETDGLLVFVRKELAITQVCTQAS